MVPIYIPSPWCSSHRKTDYRYCNHFFQKWPTLIFLIAGSFYVPCAYETNNSILCHWPLLQCARSPVEGSELTSHFVLFITFLSLQDLSLRLSLLISQTQLLNVSEDFPSTTTFLQPDAQIHINSFVTSFSAFFLPLHCGFSRRSARLRLVHCAGNQFIFEISKPSWITHSCLRQKIHLVAFGSFYCRLSFLRLSALICLTWFTLSRQAQFSIHPTPHHLLNWTIAGNLECLQVFVSPTLCCRHLCASDYDWLSLFGIRCNSVVTFFIHITSLYPRRNCHLSRHKRCQHTWTTFWKRK